MVFTRRNIWSLVASAALVLPASAATILPVSNAPIALDAESSEYDRNADRLLFRQVRITQGDLSIAADQAVANDLDFAASTWEFTGHVELDGQGSRIRASSASVRFSNHRLVHATAAGAPATFERDATPELRALSGGAEVIDYDALESRLELRGSARLVDGANSFNGHKLVYLVEEDRLLASSNGAPDKQVSVVITPTTIDEARRRQEGDSQGDGAPVEEAGDGDEGAPPPAAAPRDDPAPPPGDGDATP
jgi:lipopolysaccharide export system protein LptA